MNTHNLLFLTIGVLASGLWADVPTITDITAQQRYPWNGKVDISYTVTGDMTVGVPEWNRLVLSVSASNRTDGASYVASAGTVSGDTGTEAGVHRIVWDLDAQGLVFKSDEVVFSVVYIETPYPYCVIDLSAGANASSYPVSYMAEPPSGGFNVDLYKTTKLVLRRIEPGSFMMCGQYDVTLTKPYYMGIFEVTQKQYELVTGNKPSRYKGDMRPVETAWGVPSAFLTRTGLDLGLPTEAQWEYACRAGTTSAYNNGGDTVDDLTLLGWWKGNSAYNEYNVTEHSVVGMKRPNAWGLYDMHGNVEEWCQDWFGAQSLSSGLIDPVGPSSGSVKILRGGNCFSTADKCTSSYRHTESPSYTSATWGFRLAWTLPSTNGTNNVICSGASDVGVIDLTSGTRTAAATETIHYSTEWVDDAPSGAEAVIAVNGETLNSVSGTGFVDWTPLSNGTYTLTHKVMSGETQYGTTLTATFLAEGLNPQTPVFTPVSGTTFNGMISVVISCPTEGATIHYTTDGSEPTVESPVYSRFRITGRTTVKAIAEKYGMLSDVAVAEYAKGWCAEPVVDAAASFTGSKTKVVLSCATEDATIRYTLNGSDPDSHSTKYTGPFYVTESCTVKAYATTEDFFDSAVVEQTIEKVWGIGDTMGKPDHGFSTSGSGGLGWMRVVDTTAPGGEAMKSGAITHNQSSILSTTVTGPGTLSFAWRTSCEDDPQYEWDHAECAVDGTVIRWLCGETVWQNESVTITGDGEHTVEWRYLKDDIESEGEDATWVAGYNWVSDYTATRTTEVPVPYMWLNAHDPGVVDEYDAYEASAKATAANGYKVWECYVAGTDPMDVNSVFRAQIKMNGTVPEITWTPDLNTNGIERVYTIWGKTNLVDGAWMAPTNSAHKFFKVTVEMP